MDSVVKRDKYGILLCEHTRRKQECKECKGSQICSHNRQKSYCRDCKGSQICSHNREKKKCIDCKGSQICQHNRQIQKCRDCKGCSICEHNRIKQRCKDCKGSELCSQCTQTRFNPKYKPFCTGCYFELHPDQERVIYSRLKEKAVADKILQSFGEEYKITFNEQVGLKSTLRRPDICFNLQERAIIIEVDETQHKGYSQEDEQLRIQQISKDLQKPFVMIRFNPDSYKKNGTRIPSCFSAKQELTRKGDWESRITTLIETLRSFLDQDPTIQYDSDNCHQVKLFFNQ